MQEYGSIFRNSFTNSSGIDNSVCGCGKLPSALLGFSQLVRPMNADAKITNNFVFADVRCLVIVMLLLFLIENFSLFAGCVLGWADGAQSLWAVLRWIPFVQQTADARSNLRRVAFSEKVKMVQLMI